MIVRLKLFACHCCCGWNYMWMRGPLMSAASHVSGVNGTSGESASSYSCAG